MLVLVWTIPFRPTDILSLRRRMEDGPPASGVPPARRAGISVIVPVHNGERYLRQSLPPLVELLRLGELDEVVIVDDASTDGSAALARSLGAKVVPSGERGGPARARNLAAQNAAGEILWFVDADVVVGPDGPRLIREALSIPDVVAVFGSYDDRPPAKNFGSQYKNLVHHHYHQHGAAEASTFWSGCGAIRKDAFLAVGGFDSAEFGRPSVEDVDLGYRLRARHWSIRLDRRLQATHLKVWSVPELVRTDIFMRAVPWARLMLRRAEVIDDLNVGTVERLRAACAGAAVLTLAAVLCGLISPWWLVPVLLTNLTANWHLFGLFRRTRGLGFGLTAIAFHQVYYLYSTAAFTWCWLENKFSGRRRDTPA
jgi:GT2 family glycosyltransferase